MSKERARRRAEREAAARQERDRRERRSRRRLRRQAALRPLTEPWRLLRRRAARRADSVLLRRRRRENGVLLAGLLAVNAALWLARPAWSWRAGAALLSVMLWPVLVVLVFDRRAGR